MKTITAVSDGQLRGLLLQLIEACPFDHTNPQDCPLSGVRQLRLPDRAQWIQALPEKDLVYLAAYHHICYATKMPVGKGKQAPECKPKVRRDRKKPGTG